MSEKKEEAIRIIRNAMVRVVEPQPQTSESASPAVSSERAEWFCGEDNCLDVECWRERVRERDAEIARLREEIEVCVKSSDITRFNMHRATQLEAGRGDYWKEQYEVVKDDAEKAEAEVQRLTEEVRRVKQQAIYDMENHESALCPEDMGCKEYIESLEADVRELRAKLAALTEENERLREHRCGLPDSISEALNSGDGTYRP